MKFLKSYEEFLNENLILEGGSYGHLNHPFEDYSLTFKDLKTIVDRALGGYLDKEELISEKLDGYALSITWKHGQLFTARNKGHLKNYGKDALTVDQLIQKFENRGELSKAFSLAITELNKIFSKIDQSILDVEFETGKKFMNIEIIYPSSPNVIVYDSPKIIMHGFISYDFDGNPIDENNKISKNIVDVINLVNKSINSIFKVHEPNYLNISKHNDFSVKQNYFHKKIDDIRDSMDMNDNSTLEEWHIEFWKKIILNSIAKHETDFDGDVFERAAKRLAFKNGTIISIKELELNNLGFIKMLEKSDSIKNIRQNIRDKFESIFTELGVTVLKNISGFLSVNSNDTVKVIKDNLDKKIKEIENTGGKGLLDVLQLNLNKIEALGGFDSIMPSEGIVFVYNSKRYKLTGSFSPVNQIMGLLRF